MTDADIAFAAWCLSLLLIGAVYSLLEWWQRRRFKQHLRWLEACERTHVNVPWTGSASRWWLR